jgi:DNA-binding transcriptional LysR family regulator
MKKETAADLVGFLVVAQELSFTRAAAKLGVSQSALSQTMRGLENRLGVPLLMRTTRRVSVTEAGERLLRKVGLHFAEMDAELEAVAHLCDKPVGKIRLTATESAIVVLWPALERFLSKYPDIKLELVVGHGLTDIIAEQCDAGVRPGETVVTGMVMVRIAPDMRMAVVGAPSYFAERKPPIVPHDLTAHNCINLRYPNNSGLPAWEFGSAGREMSVQVEGQLVLGGPGLILMAARAGAGLAYLSEEQVCDDLESGRLVRVLADWCPPYTGYHLYYPSMRQPTPAFALLVEALRYRGLAQNPDREQRCNAIAGEPYTRRS